MNRVITMKSLVSLIAILMLSLFSADVSCGQQATPESVFTSFRQSVGKLSKKAGPRATKLSEEEKQKRENLNQINQDVAFLQEQVASGELTPVPEQYLKSLALDADLLAELAARPKPESTTQRQAMTEGVQAVAADLAIKVSHLKSRKKGPTLVEVTVRAKGNGQDANDYEVWYVPKGWANKDAVFKRFDRLTNQDRPPRMFLPPGNYFVWLKKEPSKTPRQPLTVGGDGHAKREVELLIP